ncbi:MAG: hypothetical protein M3444_02145 [Acidobacteriota bacterium]|nr:hypothetical protein [Acidobacteriota bacterium]
MSAHHDSHQTPSRRRAAFAAQDDEGADKGRDDSLEDAARDERRYARERLRQELGRDPTEEEVNEWLRQQTEGY